MPQTECLPIVYLKTPGFIVLSCKCVFAGWTKTVEERIKGLLRFFIVLFSIQYVFVQRIFGNEKQNILTKKTFLMPKSNFCSKSSMQ